MGGNQIDFSILIWEAHGPDLLKDALSSLSRLDYPFEKFEVLIIDALSIKEEVESMASKLPFKVHYCKKPDATKSESLNFGLRKASGRIIVFTEDDCLFEKDWLKIIERSLYDKEVGAVGGYDKALTGNSSFNKCLDYVYSSFITTGGLRRGDQKRIGEYYPKLYNMSVPRDVINEVGYLSENIISCQSLELASRIKRAGYKVVYDPGNFVWHWRMTNLCRLFASDFKMGYTCYLIKIWTKQHTFLAGAVLAMLALSVSSFWSIKAFKILIALMGLYLIPLFLAGFHASVILRDPKCLLLVPVLVFIIHISKGTGFLLSFLRSIFAKILRLKRAETKRVPMRKQ